MIFSNSNMTAEINVYHYIFLSCASWKSLKYIYVLTLVMCTMETSSIHLQAWECCILYVYEWLYNMSMVITSVRQLPSRYVCYTLRAICHIMRWYAALHSSKPYCFILCYTEVYYAILSYIITCYILLHCTTLHCTLLHCTTSYLSLDFHLTSVVFCRTPTIPSLTHCMIL